MHRDDIVVVSWPHFPLCSESIQTEQAANMSTVCSHLCTSQLKVKCFSFSLLLEQLNLFAGIISFISSWWHGTQFMIALLQRFPLLSAWYIIFTKSSLIILIISSQPNPIKQRLHLIHLTQSNRHHTASHFDPFLKPGLHRCHIHTCFYWKICQQRTIKLLWSANFLSSLTVEEAYKIWIICVKKCKGRNWSS